MGLTEFGCGNGTTLDAKDLAKTLGVQGDGLGAGRFAFNRKTEVGSGEGNYEGPVSVLPQQFARERKRVRG